MINTNEYDTNIDRDVTNTNNMIQLWYINNIGIRYGATANTKCKEIKYKKKSENIKIMISSVSTLKRYCSLR